MEPLLNLYYHVQILHSIWSDLVYHEEDHWIQFRGAFEQNLCLCCCTSFHEQYFCIKQILDYINANIPLSQDNYSSLDKLLEECGVIPDDFHWDCEQKLGYIACDNDNNKSIWDLLMAYLSLQWLHEDDLNFDQYNNSPQVHTYNNCVQVGDTVLYYI